MPVGAGARSPGLIVITERARPADRVSASLAGADGVLVRPPSRGDLARALEDIGVALPSDPRSR